MTSRFFFVSGPISLWVNAFLIFAAKSEERSVWDILISSAFGGRAATAIGLTRLASTSAAAKRAAVRSSEGPTMTLMIVFLTFFDGGLRFRFSKSFTHSVILSALPFGPLAA